MSRRYIFFKLSADARSFSHATAFAELELKRYLDVLHPVVNVFELLKIPDVARLIDRDIRIQHLITAALPAFDHHGYVATVSDEVQVEPFFRALNFIDEIFVFQRSHLPRDAFISMLIGKGLLQRYEVYNWHIFHGKTMSYYLRILQSRRPNLRSTEAIEKVIKSLDRESSLGGSDPESWEPEPHFTTDGFFSLASFRPQKALVNWLTAGGSTLIDLSPGGGGILQYASMRGISALGIATDALQTFLCNSKSFFFDIPLHLISEGIQKLSERLMQLSDARITNQIDLFLVDLDKEYLLYRTKQVLGAKHLPGRKRTGDKNLFLMGRFLIDKNFITHNRDLNQFLLFVLVKTVMQPRSINSLHNFINAYKSNAQEIYLDLFTISQFTQLFGIKPEKTIAILNDPFNFKAFLTAGTQYGLNIHLIPCKKPFHDALYSWLREQFDPLKTKLPQNTAKLNDMPDLGFYTREKLDFLKSFLKHDEFLPYQNNCQQTYRLLAQIQANQKHIRRIAITTAGTVFHVNDKPHTISYARVIEEMLEQNFPQIKASIVKQITYPIVTQKDCQYEILLLEIH